MKIWKAFYNVAAAIMFLLVLLALYSGDSELWMTMSILDLALWRVDTMITYERSNPN